MGLFGNFYDLVWNDWLGSCFCGCVVVLLDGDYFGNFLKCGRCLFGGYIGG